MADQQNFVSVSRRPPDVEDYIDTLRRYRSWVIGPTFAGLVIAVVVAFFWPNMYICSAAMQIKPGAVSNSLMPTMNGQMAQRLQQLELEILGRDNLIVLIQNAKLDLYKKERARYSVEDVAEDTFRKHVHIQQYETGGSANGATAFRIWFEYPDRYKARALVVELISEFQNKEAVLQSNNAHSTSTLFEDLVKTAREKMEKAQMEIADFTSQNQGRLPENFQANMAEVQTKQGAISNVNQQIGQEKQRQAILESNLNNNKNLQTETEANLTSTVNTSSQTVRNSSLINIEGLIASKRAECAALLRRYQPDYPEVLACNDQVQSFEERKETIEKTESSPAQPGSIARLVTNPQVAQQLNQLKAEESNIVSQIRASALQVEVLQKQGMELTRQLKEVQDKINASPQIIQRFNGLSQDLQMAKDEYTNLSKNKEAAGTAQSLEEHQAGETLDILENPILPENPTSPLRGAIVAIGTVVGMMVGVVLAGAKEVKNTSLKNLKDVRAYTNLPVLSSIPLLENALLVRRKRRLAWLAWSSAVIVGSILMTGAMYYHYFVAQQI
jgi:succinoglycan biosynthesis transport protein ExoP